MYTHEKTTSDFCFLFFGRSCFVFVVNTKQKKIKKNNLDTRLYSLRAVTTHNNSQEAVLDKGFLVKKNFFSTKIDYIKTQNAVICNRKR